MHQPIFDEVIELHRFIQRWMTGAVPGKRDPFLRFSDALADEFHIIHPGGTTENRAQVLESFWSAHGTREESFQIEIRNIRLRFSSEPYFLVTYEEWQIDSTTTARTSSALFRKSDRDENPHWVHLHETWLPVDCEERFHEPPR